MGVICCIEVLKVVARRLKPTGTTDCCSCGDKVAGRIKRQVSLHYLLFAQLSFESSKQKKKKKLRNDEKTKNINKKQTDGDDDDYEDEHEAGNQQQNLFAFLCKKETHTHIYACTYKCTNTQI